MRAVAVLLVLGYHAFPETVSGGYVGVDVFFVISGFLITGIILDGIDRGSFSLEQFYRRRIRRIFPALLIVLTASLCYGWFVFLPKDFQALGRRLLGGTAFLANILEWQDTSYFDTSNIKPLVHLWSLGIEEQFYLLWPGLLCLISQRPRIRAFAIALILLCSFALNLTLTPQHQDAAFYLPFPRFWELLIGAVLALPARGLAELSPLGRNCFSAAGASLIMLSGFSFTALTPFPGWWALLPVIGAAALVAAGPSSFINRRLLALSPVVWIGLISYPLYLWHWPLLAALRLAGYWHNVEYRWAALLLSAALAAAVYYAVERPLRESTRLRFVSNWLAGIAVLVALSGYGVDRLRGIPARWISSDMPQVIKEILDPAFEVSISTEWREHQCFLAKGETFADYADFCFEKTTRPHVLLWGDSHAAALYGGLAALQRKYHFALTQLTSTLCAPVLGIEASLNPLCKSINEQTLAFIRDVGPDVLVLHAQWLTEAYEWDKLLQTFDVLQSLGLEKIIVVGAAPAWDQKVPLNILAYYRQFGRLPSEPTAFNLNAPEAMRRKDGELRIESERRGFVYVSAVDRLCTPDGCRLLFADSIGSVVSYDEGHLSPLAAQAVAEAMEAQLPTDRFASHPQ